MGYLYQIPSLRARGIPQKSLRGWRMSRNKTPWISKLKAYVSHRDWSSMPRVCTVPHQILLHMNCGLQFSVFMGFPGAQMRGSLILVPSHTLFFFCCFVLSKFNVIVFVLSFYTLFCYIKNERMSEWISEQMNENLVTRVNVNNWTTIYNCWESENQFSPMEWC